MSISKNNHPKIPFRLWTRLDVVWPEVTGDRLSFKSRRPSCLISARLIDCLIESPIKGPLDRMS